MLVGNLVVDGEWKSMFTNGMEDWHVDQIYTQTSMLRPVPREPEGRFHSLAHLIDVPYPSGEYRGT